MKKLLFVALSLSIMAVVSLTSCGGDEPDDPNKPNGSGNSTQSDISSQLDGVWSNGDFFFSYNKEEKYLSACFSDSYLDNGKVTIEDKKLTVNNPCFSVQNTYTVTAVSASQLSVKIEYIDQWGASQTKSMTFNKTSELPTEKDNSWYGKYINSYGNFEYFGIVKYDFFSYYTGKKIAAKGNAQKYPVRFYYITRGDIIYMMELPESQVPTIGAWNVDTYEVKTMQLIKTDSSEELKIKYL